MRMSRRATKRLLLGMVLSLAVAGCSDNQGSGGGAGQPGDRAVGKALAEQQCKGCHGLDGKGIGPAIPNLAGQRERYLFAALKEYAVGRRSHSALRDIAMTLGDRDARNVAAYYAGLPPISAPETSPPMVSPFDRGKSVAEACTPCHGLDGNSKASGTPNLAGQQPRYFVTALQEYLTGQRNMAPMHGLIRDMSRRDMESVAIYFASQTPVARPAPPFGSPTAGEPLTALCGGCHGAHGVGDDAAIPNLAAQDPDYLVRSIKAYRTSRKHPEMQRAVPALKDPDVDSIAAYYAVQKGRPALDGQRLIGDITERCDRCHAGNIENPALAIPKLNGQDRDYLVMALRSYRDNKRQSSAMHLMSVPYSDTVIDNIASLYAARPAK